MEKQNKIYAVCISAWDNEKWDALNGIYNAYNEAIFIVSGVTEAKRRANEYRKAWDLRDEKIQYIRVITQEEYNERINTEIHYNANQFNSELIYLNGFSTMQLKNSLQ